jgi:hypothetical protein
VRESDQAGVLAFIDDIAARLAPHDPQSARVISLSVYALMVGTLQLSRALADRQLADDVLRRGIHNALAVLNIAPEQLGRDRVPELRRAEFSFLYSAGRVASTRQDPAEGWLT